MYMYIYMYIGVYTYVHVYMNHSILLQMTAYLLAPQSLYLMHSLNKQNSGLSVSMMNQLQNFVQMMFLNHDY